MKKIFILLLFYYVYDDVHAQQTIICGNVKNVVSKEFLVNLYFDPVSFTEYVFSDSINEHGDFKIRIDHESFVYGSIQLGREKQLVFLEPNDSLYITLEEGKFDETIKFNNGIAGHNQECYNAYFLRFILAPSLDHDPSKRIHMDDAVDDEKMANIFIHRNDSLTFIQLAYIDSFKAKSALSEGFYEYIKSKIIYDPAFYVLETPSMKKMFGENKKPGPPKFPKIYDEYISRYNINDEKLIGYESYVRFLSGILKMNEIRQWDSATFKDIAHKYRVKQKIIDSLFTKVKVKNVILANEISMGLMMGDYLYLLPLYKEFKEKNFDAILGEAIQNKMSAASQLKTSDFAPAFTLKDVNGKSVSLNDFKGKLVYIDFWATWCGPCVAEMPASKKLQIRYENEDIVFVFISLDEDEKRWKNFIAKNKLGGVQLRTNGYSSMVAKAYNIAAVPEYVLIDQKGRIIKYGAPRPSNKSTSELFNQYLPQQINTKPFKHHPNEY